MKVASWVCLFLCIHLSFGAIQHTLNGMWTGYNASYQIAPFDTWVGSKLPIVQLYDNFCGTWIWDYPLPTWAQQSIPFITFQPEQPTCGSTTPSEFPTLIAEGKYDDYLKQFLGNAKTFLSGPNGIYGDDDDRRIYLRFAHEMNGNWYPWSGNTTAYKLMWIHFWTLAQQAGINNTRMQWVWNVNWQDIPSTLPCEEYYPGNDYVDWVTIDGYNNAKFFSWSSWMEPDQIFTPMVKRLVAMAPGKPLGIPEVGSSTSGYTPADKSAWITSLYQFVLANDIRLVMWFNDETLAYGYTDYGVFGSRNGTSTYVSPITHQSLLVYNNYVTQVNATSLPIDPKNPRIITDDQFAGNFS
jgi:beta-mannanase